ncbi:hypothetical protein FQY83_01840 [Luteimonas marina]|uniref:Peptidase inhibitor I78 family protein n=1 Tax=Luteimonas marina TaxID=488485 RepID=A0A5C5UCX1_9GAMM|nr:hypothetical protein [Luteimonas marina]TWT23410.1 hypothetical protein FQY83_01840 [Luteimonas marina]
MRPIRWTRVPGARWWLPASSLLLAGCLATPGPQVQGSGRCDDSALGWAVGQPADEATLRRLSRESGAGLVNPVGPDSVSRGDRRDDRLRVYLDAANLIQAARCE